MQKRQIVLLVLMALAMAYGAYELFLRPLVKEPYEASKVEVEEARKLSETMSQSMKEVRLGEGESYVLEAASSRWSRNPFYAWPAREDNGDDPLPDEEREPLFYTGFLEMGGKRLAVINGLEYRVGEDLAGGRFVVQRITSGNVTLQSRKSQLEITIPYEDVILID